jgi:hypothetical protein
MQKLIRSVVLLASLSLSLAPALSAETMGSNPRPTQHITSMLDILKSILWAYMGM